MELNEYQDSALRTAIYPGKYSIIYPSLGLAGESGEVADKVKKVIRDHSGNFADPVTRKEIAKEVGDVLWYVAAVARDIGYTLEEIAQMNIDKLSSRYDRGKIRGDGDNR